MSTRERHEGAGPRRRPSARRRRWAWLARRVSRLEEAMAGLARSPTPASAKEWYTTAELAAALGVTVYTAAERWCKRGRVEAEKDPATGRWRIPAREYYRLVAGGGLRPARPDGPGQ